MTVRNQHASSGRFVKDNGRNVNLADIIDSVYLDGNHNVIVIMDNSVKRTLDGDMYRFGAKISNLANNESEHIEIQTGSTQLYITNVSFSPDDGGVTAILKEGASISGTPTSLTSFNELRSSSKTSNATFQRYDNSAVVTGGTAIETLYIPGTGKNAGETFSSNVGFVLKPNTTYVRTITNNSGGNITLGVQAEYYEFV